MEKILLLLLVFDSCTICFSANNLGKWCVNKCYAMKLCPGGGGGSKIVIFYFPWMAIILNPRLFLLTKELHYPVGLRLMIDAVVEGINFGHESFIFVLFAGIMISGYFFRKVHH